MRWNSSLFFAVIFSLIFSSCGEINKKFSRQKSDTTAVKFGLVQDGMQASGVLVRGMMIYLKSVDPNGFSQALKYDTEDFVAGTTTNIPNGKYHILAVGWDGASPFTASGSGVRCAKLIDADAVDFNGTPRTVDLTMNNATCDFSNATGNSFRPPDAAFPYGTAISLRDLHVKFCNGTSVSTASCVSPTTSISGNYGQAELLAYKKMGPNIIETSPGLLSTCVAESGGTFNTNGMIPGNANAGSPQLFAVKFRMYSTVSCPGAPLNTYFFPHGFAFGSQDIPFIALDTASTHNAVLLNYGP